MSVPMTWGAAQRRKSESEGEESALWEEGKMRSVALAKLVLSWYGKIVVVAFVSGKERCSSSAARSERVTAAAIAISSRVNLSTG